MWWQDAGYFGFWVTMVSTAAVSCASLMGALLLLRRQKVLQNHRSCFGRLELVGFRSNRQLRALDKSIALSIPPLIGADDEPQKKPFKRGLLMIGGFGDMPHMWEGLAARAAKEGWYTLAPRTPGWGRTDFDEAMKVSWTDWVLACRDSLAVTRGLCEEVTIVAHSTGAPVAALVAELFEVERLIFTGPNFVSQAGDRWAKKLLLRPVIGRVVTSYLNTVVKKRRNGRPIDSLNVAAYPTAFYLTCLPVHTLRQMWMMQDQLSRPWKVSGEVIMAMGESDESVAPLLEQADFVRRFVPEDVPFKACSIPNAAHGLPTETEGVVDTVANIILGKKGMIADLLVADKQEIAAAKKKGVINGSSSSSSSGNGIATNGS